MSDIQRDREERQNVIEVLQNMVDWMQEIDDIATPERIHALFYAIASIKTDLRYDLLYEETSGQADKPTTKNNLGVDAAVVPFGDAISRQEAIDTIRQLYLDLASQKAVIDILKVLPSVTPQLSSGLDKNSKKLENPTTNDYLGVDYLGVDCISRADVLQVMQDNWHIYNGDLAMQESMDDIRALPSVTPIRPKGYWISHREHCENLGVMPSGLGAYEWCSNCDCGIDVREWHRSPYNYCPNCGADMREVEDE